MANALRHRGAVLVPVKAFGAAKVRLAPALGTAERASLARMMACSVVAAAAPLPVWVACEDATVAAWAKSVGAGVIWTPGLGLNGAVQHGVSTLADGGFDQVVVAHADLPHARGLARLAEPDGVTLVPDRSDDGTNVASVPSRASLRFSYGAGSFARHCQNARALGLALSIARIPELQYDIDLPADLVGRR